MSPSEVDSTETYPSDLASTSSRWLSRALQHTLAMSWQTPDDFLQHFSPEVIMQALADADELRARLLVKLANVHERIAAKKSLASATEDLRLALDEKVTTPEAVLELFPADDRVRHLKAPLLWRFMFEDAFFLTTPTDGETAHQRAVRRLNFLVTSGLEESLLSLKDIVDGIGIERLTDSLPPEELKRVVTRALQLGREKSPLDEERLLDVVSLAKVLGYVPLDVIWQNVIVRRIAEPYGFVDEQTSSSRRGAPAEPSAAAILNEAPISPPKSPAKPNPAASPTPPSAKELSSQLDEAPASSAENRGSDDEARIAAVERLKEIDRLPPSHEKLATSILYSIESMYADLFEASTDEERAECIHESFPNESHLRSAMLALAELLEPSIDVTRPPISEADTEALVKLVVFEERRRKDGGAASRSSVRPPPLPVGRTAGSIPAAARMSVPPPLPGTKSNRSE
jgi:hypothetical protein